MSRLILSLLIFSIWFAGLSPNDLRARNPRLEKDSQSVLPESWTAITLNNWIYFMYPDGRSGITPGGDGGGIYPRDAVNVIYQDGVMWGGYVILVADSSVIRVGGQRYRIGTIQGWIETPGDGVNPPVAANPNDPRARIYRIRRDWQNLANNPAELLREARAYYHLLPNENVSEVMLQRILDSYRQDWEEWPGDLGAPFYDRNGNGRWDLGVDEPGIADADQVVWCVVNDLDADRTQNAWNCESIGLELQITAWAYNDPASIIGQIIFKRFVLINKSGHPIDSMFIGQWSDPDVGQYYNDLIGCDSVLNLAFAYSPYEDELFRIINLPTPAAGYVLLQGPRVPSPGDSAVFKMRTIAGFRNISMTNFCYFNWDLGYPPPMDWYDGYRYLSGKVLYKHRDGPYYDRATRFPLNGDPVTGEGDLDGRGKNALPGDRQFLFSSGPFTMQPGDTQEVIVALVGGIGYDRLKSIVEMKKFAHFAKILYDQRFSGPFTPYPPRVKATPLDRSIVLEWGTDSTVISRTEQTQMGLGLHFEGYNVYQLPDAQTNLSAAKKIATFDLANGITRVVQRIYLPEFGYFVEMPVQQGNDSGVNRYLIVDWDFLNNQPIYPGQTYYFAVTAYAIRKDEPQIGLTTTESSPQVVSVTAQWPPPGVRYEGEPEQSLPVEHVSGTSEGTVQVTVVDPAAVTGHEYELFFQQGDSDDTLRWNLRDLDTGVLVLTDQPVAADYIPPIVDGLQLKLDPPPAKIKRVAQVDYQGWEEILDENLNLSLNSEESRQAGEVAFFLDATNSASNPAQNLASWNWKGAFDYRDYLIEFPFAPDTAGQIALNPWAESPDPETGSYYLRGWLSQTYLGEDSVVHTVGRLPLRVWKQVSPGEWEQIMVGVKDVDGNWLWNPAQRTAFTLDGAENGFEPLFVFDYPYREDSLLNDPTRGEHYARELWWDEQEQHRQVLGKITFGMWLDRQTDKLFGGPPSPGTVVRFFAYRNFGVDDVYRFRAPGVKESLTYAREDVDKITVYPNPYYASNPQQGGRFEKFVTFTHLPHRAIIRVFNLAGQLITRIEKNDDSQFLRLPLRNRNGILLASGIYIAHIEMPELGKEKVVKFVIIQEPDMPLYIRPMGVPQTREW